MGRIAEALATVHDPNADEGAAGVQTTPDAPKAANPDTAPTPAPVQPPARVASKRAPTPVPAPVPPEHGESATPAKAEASPVEETEVQALERAVAEAVAEREVRVLACDGAKAARDVRAAEIGVAEHAYRQGPSSTTLAGKNAARAALDAAESEYAAAKHAAELARQAEGDAQRFLEEARQRAMLPSLTSEGLAARIEGDLRRLAQNERERCAVIASLSAHATAHNAARGTYHQTMRVAPPAMQDDLAQRLAARVTWLAQRSAPVPAHPFHFLPHEAHGLDRLDRWINGALAEPSEK